MWKNTTILLSVVLGVSIFGLVMLFSTSAIQARQQHGSELYYVLRQGIAFLAGLVALGVTWAIDYRRWRSLATPLLGAAAILLLLVWAPGIGRTVKGSSRWIVIGGLSLQPSEFAKLAVVIWLAAWMDRNHRYAFEFRRGLLIPLIVLGMVLFLIFAEPDYGTTLLLGAVVFGILFVGGTRVLYLLLAGVLGSACFIAVLAHNPVRMRRIMAFLNPEKYAEAEAFQLLNAIYAFVVGGGRGVGLGQSMQKRWYLPEAHTDFIFAIIGEELGVVASLGLVLAFLTLLWCGIRITYRAPDHFGRLVALGLTILLTLQAIINVAVVSGSMPTKGLPLPFVSYGGTSMVMSMAMVGVLLNIAHQAARLERGGKAFFIRDAVHQV